MLLEKQMKVMHWQKSRMKFCEALNKQKRFDAFSLMPTNLYGPNDNYDDNNSWFLLH